MKAEILYHFMQNIGIWNEESKKVYYGMYWDRLVSESPGYAENMNARIRKTGGLG